LSLPRKGETRRTLRDDQRDSTRQRLVRAAQELFAEHGYSATLEEIALRAGASRATFYLHFTTKADLLVEIASDHHDGIITQYARLDEALHVRSRPAVRAWLSDTLAMMEGVKLLYHAFDQAAATDPKVRAAVRESLELRPDAMPKYLAEWPTSEQGGARLRIELLVLQLERFYLRWAVTDTLAADRDQAVDVLTDMWYAALVTSCVEVAKRRGVRGG
jgi:AcrR family transcriptional regulator